MLQSEHDSSESRQEESSTMVSSIHSRRLKNLSLGVLVLQTTSLVLTMRYSRTLKEDAPRYLASSAVVSAEVIKIIVCTLLVFMENSEYSRPSPYRFQCAGHEPAVEGRDCEKTSGDHEAGHSCGFGRLRSDHRWSALSCSCHHHLTQVQVTYQLKILTTALFSVSMLGRRLGSYQWLSLLLLMAGVTLVQWPMATGGDSEQKVLSGSIQFVGLMAVLMACISSGFAGVYFEKILKETKQSLWVRNIQLGLFGFVFGTIGMMVYDGQRVTQSGMFQGYNKITCTVVVLQRLTELCPDTSNRNRYWTCARSHFHTRAHTDKDFENCSVVPVHSEKPKPVSIATDKCC
ncbi:solute carrier family 35 member A3b isoform X5 [Vanacampus margaritifer]